MGVHEIGGTLEVRQREHGMFLWRVNTAAWVKSQAVESPDR
jgi:hypothetical protein